MKKVKITFIFLGFIFLFAARLTAQDQTIYVMPLRVYDSLLMARNFHLDGFTAKAKAIYTRYYPDYPADVDILYGLALIAEEEKEPIQALSYYNQIEAFNYSFPELYFNRGMIRFELQQYQGALEDFLQAGSMESLETQSITYKGSSYSQGTPLQLLEIFSSNTWEEECVSWQIRCLIALEREDDALQIIREKRENNPNHLPWIELEYETMIKRGDKRGAVAVLLKMIQLNPNNLTVAYNLISLQEEIMGNQEKIRAYKELLDIAPDFTEAALNLGIAYYKEQRFEESNKIFDDIISHRPDAGIVYYNRGLTLLKLKKPSAAVKDFKKGLEFLPTDHAPSYGALGIAYTELGQFREAIEALDLAFSLSPENAIYAFNLGNASYKGGDRERACVYFRKSADLGQKEALLMLARICK
jgi:tetratricopeptide (TPR) repeat protein